MATKAKSTKKSDKRLGWHFIPSNLKLTNGDGRLVEVGKTLSVPKTVKTIACCGDGMHASPTPHQAANYRKGPVLCRVEVWGEIDSEGDKFAGRNRKVLWMKELKAEDLKSCIAASGYTTKSDLTYCSVSELVAKLSTASNYTTETGKKIDKWLESWAKKNGLDGGPIEIEYVKKALVEKDVKSFLSDRVVRTFTELERDMKGVYDVDGELEDSNGDSNQSLDDILRDMEWDGDVIRLDNYTESGVDGFVLKLKRKR